MTESSGSINLGKGPGTAASTGYSINPQGKSGKQGTQVGHQSFIDTLRGWVYGIIRSPGGNNAYAEGLTAAQNQFGPPPMVVASRSYGQPAMSNAAPRTQQQGQGTTAPTMSAAPGAQPASIEGERARVEAGGTFFARPVASLPKGATLSGDQFESYHARYIDELTGRGISTVDAGEQQAAIGTVGVGGTLGFNGESWGHTQDGWVLNGVSNGTDGVNGEYHTGIGHFVTANGQRVWQEQTLQQVYSQYGVEMPDFPTVLPRESQGLIDQFEATPPPPVAKPADASASAVADASAPPPLVAQQADAAVTTVPASDAPTSDAEQA